MGVQTWDEVVALFGEGGKYAGQWGWLEVLRNARINDQVAFSTPSDDPARINPRQTYRGRFTEDDNGNLMLVNKDGRGYGAGEVFLSHAHNTLTLFRDSLPGAAVTVQNSFVGQWRGNEQYLHLKSVNWDKLTNILEWEEVYQPLLGGAALTVSSAGLIVMGGGLCTSGVGCFMGAFLIGAGIGGTGAGLYFMSFGVSRADHLMNSSLEWAP